MPENPANRQGEIVPPDDASPEAAAQRVESRWELSMHSGPLPPPEEFRVLAELIPNGAERIMRMAEKEQDARLWSNRIQEWRAVGGVASGFLVAVAAFAVAAYGFSVGATVEAAGVAGATLVSLVGVFIRGTSTRQMEERAESKKPVETDKTE